MANVNMEGKSNLRMDFPSNSKTVNRSAKKDEVPQKEVKQITKGVVKRKKKSAGRKFVDSFFETDDVENIGEYILNDIVIPEARNIVYNIFANGLSMLLFGENMPKKGVSRYGGKSIVNYSGISSGKSRNVMTQRNRAAHHFDDIILESRGEAEEVLTQMCEYIDTYDQCTVGDMYDLIGETSTHADQKYGWTNLARASTERVRDGYALKLPRPEVL